MPDPIVPGAERWVGPGASRSAGLAGSPIGSGPGRGCRRSAPAGSTAGPVNPPTADDGRPAPPGPAASGDGVGEAWLRCAAAAAEPTARTDPGDSTAVDRGAAEPAACPGVVGGTVGPAVLIGALPVRGATDGRGVDVAPRWGVRSLAGASPGPELVLRPGAGAPVRRASAPPVPSSANARRELRATGGATASPAADRTRASADRRRNPPGRQERSVPDGAAPPSGSGSPGVHRGSRWTRAAADPPVPAEANTKGRDAAPADNEGAGEAG